MKSALKSCLFLLALLCSVIINAQTEPIWNEYPTNPVFGEALGGPKAYYPSVLCDDFRFSDHGLAAKYKMWYGTEESRVGLACSEDGINWQDFGLVSGNVFYHCKVLYDPNGFGGTEYYYRMWYADPNVWPYTHETIRFAESVDGFNWINDQPIIQDVNQPLVTGVGGWWYGTYGPGAVLYNTTGYQSWQDNDPINHRFIMYYNIAPMNCIAGETEAAGLAYSIDGKYWKRAGEFPVLLSGPTGSWDSLYVYPWSVLNIEDTYYMWFSGGTTASSEGIGSAYSDDGIIWIKSSSNPIFHINDGQIWRSERTYNPSIILEDGLLKMWFSGKNSNPSQYSIGYATAVFPAKLEVLIDIMPGTDPNVFNMKQRAPVSVILFGSESFKVANINLNSLQLEGIVPKSWRIKDTSSPLTSKRDGWVDLNLTFDGSDFSDFLSNFPAGNTVTMHLQGSLNDGKIFEGTDEVIIASKGKLPHKHSGNFVTSGKVTLSNHPNPFNPATTILYYICAESFVHLAIYNLKGELVETLVDSWQTVGNYQVNWNATKYSTGIYFYVLTVGAERIVEKCIYTK